MSQPSSPPTLLSTAQAAQRLGIRKDTLLGYVHAKKIPAYRLPGGALRFYPDDVEALLQPTLSQTAG